jgi:plasmid stabilization system protein ParE
MSEEKTPYQFSKLAEQLVGDLRGVGPEDPPRAKKRPTQSLADVVEQLLQKHQIGRDSPEHTIRDNWRTLVGAANAMYSHPAVIERNRLIVLAGHAVVRNELFLHREEIVARIKQLPGCGHVKAIHLRAG